MVRPLRLGLRLPSSRILPPTMNRSPLTLEPGPFHFNRLRRRHAHGVPFTRRDRQQGSVLEHSPSARQHPWLSQHLFHQDRPQKYFADDTPRLSPVLALSDYSKDSPVALPASPTEPAAALLSQSPPTSFADPSGAYPRNSGIDYILSPEHPSSHFASCDVPPPDIFVCAAPSSSGLPSRRRGKPRLLDLSAPDRATTPSDDSSTDSSLSDRKSVV